MVRNSKALLSHEILNKLFDLFFEVVGKKASKDEFKKTMVDLLTPAERIMLAKRVAIVYLLLQKIDYRNICEVLKVSATTVAKYTLLIEKSEGLVPTFKKIIKVESVGIFLYELFNALFPPGSYGTNWKSAWQRKIDLERKKTFGL